MRDLKTVLFPCCQPLLVVFSQKKPKARHQTIDVPGRLVHRQTGGTRKRFASKINYPTEPSGIENFIGFTETQFAQFSQLEMHKGRWQVVD